MFDEHLIWIFTPNCIQLYIMRYPMLKNFWCWWWRRYIQATKTNLASTKGNSFLTLCIFILIDLTIRLNSLKEGKSRHMLSLYVLSCWFWSWMNKTRLLQDGTKVLFTGLCLKLRNNRPVSPHLSNQYHVSRAKHHNIYLGYKFRSIS